VNCGTLVSNTEHLCTCTHGHHKGKVCNQTIKYLILRSPLFPLFFLMPQSYTEYVTERKSVRVQKTKTHYRSETKQVAVTKSRVKYVDQGRWVQQPYGPGNGTHAVYQQNMVVCKIHSPLSLFSFAKFLCSLKLRHTQNMKLKLSKFPTTKITMRTKCNVSHLPACLYFVFMSISLIIKSCAGSSI
jgi:hypothetical protein